LVSKTVGGVTTTYRYNAEGRLARIEDADQNRIAEYVYDPLGRHIKKTTLLETLYFHYADEGLVGEFNEAGNAVRIYGYQPDSTWTTDPVYQKVQGQSPFESTGTVTVWDSLKPFKIRWLFQITVLSQQRLSGECPRINVWC
jgi:YD repeat-containing protein